MRESKATGRRRGRRWRRAWSSRPRILWRRIGWESKPWDQRGQDGIPEVLLGIRHRAVRPCEDRRARGEDRGRAAEVPAACGYRPCAGVDGADRGAAEEDRIADAKLSRRLGFSFASD